MNILITGGSSGLGKALADLLTKRGHRVAVMARSGTPTIIGDVTKPEDCKRAVEETVKAFGSLDLLILNAGVSMWARFEEVADLRVFEEIMKVNYLGAVYCTHFALPYLKRSGGMIVGISSIQGKIGVPYHSGYAASKHAMQGFLDTLRSEEPGIDVLVVSPSWMKGTDLKAVIRTKEKRKERGLELEDCCQKILRAIEKRKRELLLPRWYRLIGWARLICPKLLDRCVRNVLK